MKKLKQDVELRSNSTYDMLQSYKDQHEDVTTVLCLSGRNNRVYLCYRCHDAKEIMEIVQPFYKATVEISPEKKFQPFKNHPVGEYSKKVDGEERDTIGSKLNSGLNIQFAGVEDKTNLIPAVLLDPRFKRSSFFHPGFSSKCSGKV
ncbi:Zinc finger bed domain-containing protein [Plakobranchus ocellatus]|uniref:Zinc finger bed domain-containing protein n=1 Tax=Plakobranchus ocellatus TaxID=259542 RepID=A0AAV4C562_9GAST|nr:Zinc finger bed domain-containing protein [Plakobranchus ocellatus]